MAIDHQQVILANAPKSSTKKLSFVKKDSSECRERRKMNAVSSPRS